MVEYFIFERLKNGAIIEYDDEREVTVDDTMEQRVGEILGVKKLSPNHGPLLFRVSVYSMEEGNKIQPPKKELLTKMPQRSLQNRSLSTTFTILFLQQTLLS